MTTATKTLQGFTDRVEFDSSVIYEAFYDADTQRLFLILHTGSTPAYRSVDNATWEGLKYSASAGQYWNRHIRHVCPGINGDVDLFRRDPEQDIEPSYEEPEATYEFEGMDLRDSFTTNGFDTTVTTVAPLVTRTFIVQVEVQAPSLYDALNAVGGKGFEIVAVNPK